MDFFHLFLLRSLGFSLGFSIFISRKSLFHIQRKNVLQSDIGSRKWKETAYVLCYQGFSFVAEIYFFPQKQSRTPCRFPSKMFLRFIAPWLITNSHRVTFWFPSFILFLANNFFRVTSVNWENSHFIACNIFNFASAQKASTDRFFYFFPSTPEFFSKHKNPREISFSNNGIFFMLQHFLMLARASRSEKKWEKKKENQKKLLREEANDWDWQQN